MCNTKLLTALKAKKILDRVEVSDLDDVTISSVKVKNFYKLVVTKDCYDVLTDELGNCRQTGAEKVLRNGKIEYEKKLKEEHDKKLKEDRENQVNAEFVTPAGDEMTKNKPHEKNSDIIYVHEDSLKNELDFVSNPNPLEVTVRKPQVSDSTPKGKYKLTPGGKRYILLINVIRFHEKLVANEMTNRVGASVDTSYMQKLWEELGWEVTLIEGTNGEPNPQQAEDPDPVLRLPLGTKGWIEKAYLVTTVENFRDRCVADNVEAVAVYVSSHGSSDGFSTSDGDFVHFNEDILYKFDDEKLVGKPKIFVDNSCATYRNPTVDNRLKVQPDGFKNPPITDAILIKAQIPGRSAFRHPTKGSVFGVVFAHVLMNSAWNTEFGDMLKMIQRLVSTIRVSFSKNQVDAPCGQLPVPQDFLLDKLYLFPTSGKP